MKITDRQIFRMDFILHATVCPNSGKKRVTKKSIIEDLNKLKEAKFKPIDVPYANWNNFEIKKTDKSNGWLISFTFDNEDTSQEHIERLSAAYFFVLTQGINMLNDTGFFTNRYDFSIDDFELVTIEVGYLQSDGKTICFQNHE
jgi:hypothetical protein